jgi:hypothetical protein
VDVDVIARLLRYLRALAVIGSCVGVAWWACAGPLAPSIPGLAVIAVLAVLALGDLGWARDPLWHDETGLEREMTRARFRERERLCGPREEDR